MKTFNSKKYYRENKFSIKTKMIIKYHTDIDYKIKTALCARIRNALKSQKQKIPGSIVNYIGCPIFILRTHLQKKFTENMNWKNYGKWQMDHIVPCYKYDLSQEKQRRECFHYTNLQPLWASENRKKSTMEHKNEQ